MIYVIRHGQTDLNKQGRLQGRNGEPLNEEGIKQAKELKIKLQGIKFDHVFSSPQERAIETACIATNTSPTVDNRLDVFDLGSADRLKKEEVSFSFGGFLPDTTIYSGVEDPKAYFKRVFSFLDEIKSNPNMKDKNILICGHKCTTACIACYFNGMPKMNNLMNYSLKNGEYQVYDLNKINSQEKF